MSSSVATYSLPKSTFVRWLTHAGDDVPNDIRLDLIAVFFSSWMSLVLAAIGNMAVNVVALVTHPTPSFVALVAVETILLLVRIGLLTAAHRLARQKRPTPTDAFILTGAIWTCLVGIGTAMCFATADPVLQFLAPITMMGIVNGIATRNNGAPKLAVFQVMSCDLPLQFAIPFGGHAFMMLSFFLCPLFVLGMMNTIRRLSKNYLAVALAKRDSEWRATHDALTGLMNRAGIIAAIDHEGRDVALFKSDLALFYIDLDGFKTVNDNFGHAAGDELLRQVARRIVANVPSTCEAGRFGGDEFVVLAPACGVSGAATIGEKLIAALSQSFDIGTRAPVRIGASVGIACASTRTHRDVLLAEADGALYEAKNGGKGRCVIARPESSTSLRERLVA